MRNAKPTNPERDLHERRSDEVENPGDPGPNVLVPPTEGDPRTEQLPGVPKPPPGV